MSAEEEEFSETVEYGAETTVLGVLQTLLHKSCQRARNFGLHSVDGSLLDESRTLSSYRFDVFFSFFFLFYKLNIGEIVYIFHLHILLFNYLIITFYFMMIIIILHIIIIIIINFYLLFILILYYLFII